MEACSLLVNLRKGMQSSSEQPLVGEERYVTTLITAAKETILVASDCCHIVATKPLFFFAQSQSSKTRSRFVSSYTISTYRPVARHICVGRSPRDYSRRKVPITAQNVTVIFRHIFRTKLARNTLDLSQVSY